MRRTTSCASASCRLRASGTSRQLLEAVLKIPLRTREWVTFEYVLLGGVNDQPEHAREVLALLAGMRAKVNLIVWNPGPGIDYHAAEAGGCGACFRRC